MKLDHKQQESIGFRYVMDLLTPCSAYGRQALKKLQPFAPEEREAMQRELDNIEKTIDKWSALEQTYARLDRVLMQVKDIRRSIENIDGEELGEVDLFELKRFVLQLKEIAPLYTAVRQTAQYCDIDFPDVSDALALLDPENTGIPTFHISGRYSPVLCDIRAEKQRVEQQLRAVQNEAEKVTLQEHRRELAVREQAEERQVRRGITEQLRPFKTALLYNTEMIARLDLTLRKAELARQYNCCKPEIVADSVVLESAMNPCVAAALERDGRCFTPISMELQQGTTVITGANMGGKSVALKTAALQVLLIQCGFYAFAQKAETPLFDAMYLVSEDLEAVDRGLSSFGGEIVRFNEIAERISSEFAFVLLDEFARGTNPDEGAAIARAVAAYLNKRRVIAVMATHYDGVAESAHTHYQVAGLSGADMAQLKREVDAAPKQDRVGVIARHMDYGLYRVDSTKKVSRDAVNICHLLKCDKELLKLVEDYY